MLFHNHLKLPWFLSHFWWFHCWPSMVQLLTVAATFCAVTAIVQQVIRNGSPPLGFLNQVFRKEAFPIVGAQRTSGWEGHHGVTTCHSKLVCMYQLTMVWVTGIVQPETGDVWAATCRLIGGLFRHFQAVPNLDVEPRCPTKIQIVTKGCPHSRVCEVGQGIMEAFQLRFTSKGCVLGQAMFGARRCWNLPVHF